MHAKVLSIVLRKVSVLETKLFVIIEIDLLFLGHKDKIRSFNTNITYTIYNFRFEQSNFKSIIKTKRAHIQPETWARFTLNLPTLF